MFFAPQKQIETTLFYFNKVSANKEFLTNKMSNVPELFSGVVFAETAEHPYALSLPHAAHCLAVANHGEGLRAGLNNSSSQHDRAHFQQAIIIMQLLHYKSPLILLWSEVLVRDQVLKWHCNMIGFSSHLAVYYLILAVLFDLAVVFALVNTSYLQ